MMCDSCAHWHRNSQRKVPPVPSTTKRYKFLWWEWEGQRNSFDVMLDQMQRDQIIDRNTSGWCHRFPKTQRTPEFYNCGEYKEGEKQ